MSGTHRASSGRPRRKKNSGKALPAVVAAVVAVIAIGAAVFLLRPGDEAAEPASGNVPATANAPRTGTPLEFTSTEDFSYSLGAIEAGLDSQNRAYIDYLVTNTSGRTAPFEAPGQLFLREEDSGSETCAPHEGTDEGLCGPPTKWEIKSVVGDVQPSPDGVDQYMPEDAAFIVRVATEQPVAEGASVEDFKLYVWDVRFVENRIAQGIPLP